MKKYSLENQKILATWAADCAEQVLPLFESVHPDDKRPRQAMETIRQWVKDGVFKMSVIRGASLAAHAAAREAKGIDAAVWAARAAGQAVATAHVTQHAYGAAYYALKAIGAANQASAEKKIKAAYAWQAKRLPARIRSEIMGRIIVEKSKRGLAIKIKKGDDF